jgi:hypothetical protein
MQNHLIAVKHKNRKSLVELFHDDKKMTIHFLDGQLETEFRTTGFAINNRWELEIDETAEPIDTDLVKNFFINMLEQKNDLVNCFG